MNLQPFLYIYSNHGILIKLIVDRVYVQDEQVVAITMKADYHVVLGHNENGSIELSIDPGVYTFGSDGHCTVTGYALAAKKSSYSGLIKQLLAVA